MPIPKLFCVSYAFDLYIVADTQAAAEQAADDEARDELGNQMPHECREGSHEIERHEDIPSEWRDSLAYGDEEYAKEEKTLSEWLDHIQEMERAKKAVAPLPGQGELFPADAETERETDAESKD